MPRRDARAARRALERRTIVTGTEKTEIVATYDAEGTGCIPAAVP